MYEYIDENIKEIKKYTNRIFNNSRLNLMKFDEINSLRADSEVTSMYKKLKKKAEKFYKGLIEHLSVECGFNIDDYPIEEFLFAYDDVLLYAFASETERKNARYFESVLAIGDVNSIEMMNQQKKNVRFWNQQVEEFGVGIERKIRLTELKKDGAYHVKWVTSGDEKVCEACADLNGLVFEINNIHKRPHLGCRCVFEKVD